MAGCGADVSPFHEGRAIQRRRYAELGLHQLLLLGEGVVPRPAVRTPPCCPRTAATALGLWVKADTCSGHDGGHSRGLLRRPALLRAYAHDCRTVLRRPDARLVGSVVPDGLSSGATTGGEIRPRTSAHRPPAEHRGRDGRGLRREVRSIKRLTAAGTTSPWPGPTASRTATTGNWTPRRRGTGCYLETRFPAARRRHRGSKPARRPGRGRRAPPGGVPTPHR